MNRMPSALRLSMRMPRKLRNSSVDIARITSGLLEFAVSPCGMPDPQLVSGGKEAVTQAGVLLLVAKLLEDVREQVLGVVVVRLGLHQLVHDLRGEQILALVMQFAGRGP